MSSSKKKVFIKTNKKIASSVIAYSSALIFVLIVASVVASAYLVYKKSYAISGLLIILAGLGVSTLVYWNNTYTWVLGGTLERRCGLLVYEYMEVVDALGRSKCTYTMKNIKKVVVGKRYLKVYGKTRYKGVIGKEKYVKKFIVYDYSKEALEFLKDNLPSSVVFKEK